MSKDVEKMTEDEALEQIERHKDNLHRKVLLQGQVEESKRQMAASHREQLKEIKEEIQSELDSIDELERHVRSITAAGSIDPVSLKAVE